MKKATSRIRPISRLASFSLALMIVHSLTISPIAAASARSATSDRTALPTAPSTTAIQQESTADPSQLLTVFTNGAAINIPDDGVTGTSSTIAVSGMVGPISSVSVTLNNYTTPRPQQVDFLLVGPGGQKFILVSDVGGTGPGSASNNINLTLSDSGATLIGQNPGGAQALVSGTFKPSDYDASVSFPTSAAPYQSPAPLGSATFNSVFGGLSGASVNGNWVLHVFDSSAGSGASTVAGGWSIDVVTTAAAATTTVLSSSANPSFTNQAITLTSTTTSTSTVNTGTVTFVDGTTSVTLCNNVAVNGSGQATCTVPANTLSERIHSITATYNGNATFATSNGNISQTVNCPSSQAGNTFTNPCGVSIPDAGAPIPATPYSSNIIVSGLSGSISKVTLTLTNANLSLTSHYNFMLVGPGGQNYVFFSDAGGNVASSGVTITLDDAGASPLPNSGSIASGTYRPADYNADSDPFPAPAPVPTNLASPAGSATFASVYGGLTPNGTWRLYASDDAGGGAAATIGSWSLTFTTSGDAATTTTLSANPNPATTAQAITFTATVTSTSTVNAGTVTFRRGATNLCAAVPVVSGTATCNQPAFAQGDYLITADYNGAPGQFNISSGNTTLQVNSPTVQSGTTFSNNGGITINDASSANPYPSRIIVGGLGGTITKVTLQLNNLSNINPDHMDLLLVGPNGTKFLFMGDAGGTTDMVGVNLVLDDAAGTALPDSTAIASGTYRPAAYTGDPDVFPAPAPSSPYNPAAPEGTGTFALFNGITPNGTWSLYAVEDTGDATNVSIGSWGLTFTLSPASTTTTVTSSVNPSVFGQPVTFTATVATAGLGTPSGNVQFFDGATPIGGAVALNASGQAQVTTSTLTIGNHAITANYSGNVPSGFNSSSGTLSGGQTVNKASTSTAVSSSGANPTNTGTTLTFTATVSPTAPGAGTRTGTVTFTRNGTTFCSNVAVNASGQATCVMAFSAPGNTNIVATYSGDTNFNGSTSAAFVQQVIGPLTQVTWSGGTSSDWHAITNWAPYTTPTGEPVLIPGGTPNQPSITSLDVTISGTGTLILGAGATLTIGANRTLTVGGNVTLSSGIVTGPGTLELSTGSAITRTTGQVNSTLRKNFAGPGPVFTFPVGTTGAYSPIDVTVTSLIAGTPQLTVRANTGMPSVSPIGLDAQRTLQRYWTLTGSGIRSNITFNYLDTDVPPAPNNENMWGIIRVTGNTAVGYPDALPYVIMSPGTNQFTITDLESYSHWTAGMLIAPTAANAGVSGRVMDSTGRGVTGARVSILDQSGQIRYAITNPFGYYRFVEVQVGQTYLIDVRDKRFTFEPRTVVVGGDLTDIDFISSSEEARPAPTEEKEGGSMDRGKP